MHNIVASGGVCQDLVLHFCVDLAKHNVSMAALDVFQRKVKGTRLSKTFFEDRVAGPPSMSIKAFASEILDAVSVLCLFAETVLKPIKEMLEFTHLLDLMAEVLDILTMGDAAVAHTPRLQDLLLQYHTALLRTAPEATRPKLHYIHHTPGQIAKLQANLSCFAPERKHHVNKESLRHIFKDMEPALAARNAYDVLWLAQQEPKCFQQFTVGGTEGVLRGHISAVVHERFGGPLAGFTWLASSSFKCGLSFILNTKNGIEPQQPQVFIFHVGSHLGGHLKQDNANEGFSSGRCRSGWLNKRNLCAWEAGGARCIGFALSFLRDRDGICYVVVEKARRTHFDPPVILPLRDVWGPFAYLEEEEGITPRFPKYFT